MQNGKESRKGFFRHCWVRLSTFPPNKFPATVALTLAKRGYVYTGPPCTVRCHVCGAPYGSNGGDMGPNLRPRYCCYNERLGREEEEGELCIG